MTAQILTHFHSTINKHNSSHNEYRSSGQQSVSKTLTN